ncbi:hypothetical protein NQ318_014502 [Aromia moschata]|uniref:RanBP2-type domain-containing protein n=1 Tax=Aromia moschata TaxID=1265417 RepID=A0AAV8YP18_9CUCU|nr:hypothetical protein NQ318_014502 [Aromia moschata]
MNIAESPCKICSLTPIEHYRNYDILNCDRPPICKCQRNNCDSTIDGQQPKNIRTTASGIHSDSYPSSNYMWTVKSVIPNTTWTCKRCTLLNSANFTVCEACEVTDAPDSNSNISPSVFIKVDNWADNEALRNPSHKPIYRRSFSELPSSQNLYIPNINRRSLEGSLLSNIPKSSTSMTDIQSSQHSQLFKNLNNSGGRNLNRSTSDITSSTKEAGISSTLYTYIGISEPDKEKQHFYENRTIIDAHKKSMEFDVEQHERIMQVLKQNNPTKTSWTVNERRWTCRQCSFAYNGFSADKCDICKKLEISTIPEPTVYCNCNRG